MFDDLSQHLVSCLLTDEETATDRHFSLRSRCCSVTEPAYKLRHAGSRHQKSSHALCYTLACKSSRNTFISLTLHISNRGASSHRSSAPCLNQKTVIKFEKVTGFFFTTVSSEKAPQQNPHE